MWKVAALLFSWQTVNAATLLSDEQMRTAELFGHLEGEAQAAEVFLQELATPSDKSQPSKSAAKSADVVKKLQDQVDRLQSNLKSLGDTQPEKEQSKSSEFLKKSLSKKDRDMLDQMDQWSEKANRRARLSGTSVVSKLKNAIHLVKKGALDGNGDAAKDLQRLMGKMGAMMY